MTKDISIPLDAEHVELLDELTSRTGEQQTELIRRLIREEADERGVVDHDERDYLPYANREKALPPGLQKEVCFRYQAPAINPDHVKTLPRSRANKQDVLAAMCRFRGVSSNDKQEIKSIISMQISDAAVNKHNKGVYKRLQQYGPSDVIDHGNVRIHEIADEIDTVSELFELWGKYNDIDDEYEEWIKSSINLTQVEHSDTIPVQGRLELIQDFIDVVEKSGMEDERLYEIIEELEILLDEFEE